METRCCRCGRLVSRLRVLPIRFVGLFYRALLQKRSMLLSAILRASRLRVLPIRFVRREFERLRVLPI